MAKKSEFITKDYLDKSFKEYTKAIIKAVDFGFKQVGLSFEENKKEHKRLEKKIDDTWTSIDKYVKAQEAFRQEFVIMKEEIRQIKNVLKEKLGVEISAL